MSFHRQKQDGEIEIRLQKGQAIAVLDWSQEMIEQDFDCFVDDLWDHVQILLNRMEERFGDKYELGGLR